MSDQSHELALRPTATLSASAAVSAGTTATDDANPAATPDDHRDPIHRVRAARARLMNRLHEFERRVTRTKEMFNLSNHIRARPIAAVGVSLAVGATVGLMRGKREPSALANNMVTVLSNIVLDVAKTSLRSWALHQLRVDADTAKLARDAT